jgi:hypothetical protein
VSGDRRRLAIRLLEIDTFDYSYQRREASKDCMEWMGPFSKDRRNRHYEIGKPNLQLRLHIGPAAISLLFGQSGVLLEHSYSLSIF